MSRPSPPASPPPRAAQHEPPSIALPAPKRPPGPPPLQNTNAAAANSGASNSAASPVIKAPPRGPPPGAPPNMPAGQCRSFDCRLVVYLLTCQVKSTGTEQAMPCLSLLLLLAGRPPPPSSPPPGNVPQPASPPAGETFYQIIHYSTVLCSADGGAEPQIVAMTSDSVTSIKPYSHVVAGLFNVTRSLGCCRW